MRYGRGDLDRDHDLLRDSVATEPPVASRDEERQGSADFSAMPMPCLKNYELS